MKKNKKIMLIMIVIFLIVICLIVGIIFGFGYDKNFKSTYNKLKNKSWWKESTEIYINGELAHIIKKFDEHPYVYVTKDQYVYCYTTSVSEITDEREVACDYYNYRIEDDYIIVYGLFDEKEMKLFYEFRNDDNQFVITYFDDDYKMIEVYDRAVG